MPVASLPVAGGLLGLARPHNAALLVAAPVLLTVISPAARRGAALLGAAATAVILLGATVQTVHVGHFSVLPWQGAYRLWAANRPNANGRYFAQEVSTFGAGEQRNPARTEIVAPREARLQPGFVLHSRTGCWQRIWPGDQESASSPRGPRAVEDSVVFVRG